MSSAVAADRASADLSPSGPAGHHRWPAGRWRAVRSLKGAAFGLPFLLGFLGVFVIPVGYAVVESLYSVRSSGLGFGGGKVTFVGLDNFARGIVDGKFWSAVVRVLVFAVVQIPLSTAVSAAMALLLDAVRRRTANAFRFALLVPFMVPGIVGTLIWVYLYSRDVGPIDRVLTVFGLHVDFYSGTTIWFSMGNLIIWICAGFNMLIMYSALQSISPELLDAARVDGASGLRVAWSIKLPIIRGTLVLTTMLSIIGMLQLFNEPALFRAMSPETVTADFTPVLMIFNTAFTNSDYNYAAALSVILAAVVGALSFTFYRLVNRSQP